MLNTWNWFCSGGQLHLTASGLEQYWATQLPSYWQPSWSDEAGSLIYPRWGCGLAPCLCLGKPDSRPRKTPPLMIPIRVICTPPSALIRVNPELVVQISKTTNHYLGTAGMNSFCQHPCPGFLQTLSTFFVAVRFSVVVSHRFSCNTCGVKSQ